MSKKILIYNWAQFDDSKHRGGGVSVYLKNVIPNYIQAGASIVFISSGCHYSMFRKDVFYKQSDNMFSDQGVRSYKIINSPIKAPAHDSFFQIENCIDNQSIITIFMELISNLGEFDEIHFHNIEGVSTRLIETLSKQTKSKIVIWFHNYHWFCPQIELFKDNEKKCLDYNSGADCLGCLPKYFKVKNKIDVHRLVSHLELNPIYNNFIGRKFEKLVINIFIAYRSILESFKLMSKNNIMKSELGFVDRTDKNTKSIDAMALDATSYERWRVENTVIINKYADVCVAVSGLVANKVISLGVNKDKVIEAPLGMDMFRPDFIKVGCDKAKECSLPLSVGYVGYGSHSKGYSFFCDVLDSLETPLSNIIDFHIIAKLSESQKRNLVGLKKKLTIRITEGYSRDELTQLSKSLDLVVVPSIWWETYNQVAYEMIMCGVPVLISDSVGISKYLNPSFVFESGNKRNFIEKLKIITADPSLLIDYWDENLIKLPSMTEHFKNLNQELKNIRSSKA